MRSGFLLRSSYEILRACGECPPYRTRVLVVNRGTWVDLQQFMEGLPEEITVEARGPHARELGEALVLAAEAVPKFDTDGFRIPDVNVN
jgi:hypothetical protein